MDAPLYDVYLTGKLADGVTAALAAQRLAALFKSTPEAMTGLISGKTQLLKRGVDKNTALKYRDALQNAGCEVAFKAQATSVDAKPAVTAQPTPAPAVQTAPATPASGLQLAPVGAVLLDADKRHTAAVVAIETAHLSLAPVGPLPAIAAAPVPTPDISHLSLAAADGNLLQDAEQTLPPAITPDTSGLSLAAVGAPIETLKDATQSLNPDTSGLELAPAGSDVLTPEERKHRQPPPPNTDHIKLAP